MRIYNQGHGGDSGYSKHQTPQQKQFRSRYRIGDLIRGTILTYATADMAWVAIDDLELLAHLHAPYPEGTKVHFLVTGLHPDIVLKEAEHRPGEHGSGLHLIG
jgi:hypothetical protein